MRPQMVHVQKSMSLPRPKSKDRKTPSFSMPLTTYVKRQTANNNYTVSSFSNGAQDGIRITGHVYLKDLYNYKRTDVLTDISNNVCYTNIMYVHPDMLTGRVALLSRAFNKYRFKKLCLEFRGNYATTQAGEVFLTYCEDPMMDPTVLKNRQIKSWMDSMACSDSGPVYAQRSSPVCSVARPEDPKWYSLSRDAQDISSVCQGKFLVATTLCPVFDAGELNCSFDLELCDDEMDLGEIVASVAKTQGTSGESKGLYFKIQSSTDVNTDLGDVTITPGSGQTTTVPAGSVGEGVYSVVIQESFTGGLTLSRAVEAGIDMVGTIVTGATGVPVLRLFDSFAELTAGNRTKLIAPITAAITSGWVTLTRLLGSDGDLSLQLSNSKLLSIKGFRDHYTSVGYPSFAKIETKSQVVHQERPVLLTGAPMSPYGEVYQDRSQERNYSGFRLGTPQ